MANFELQAKRLDRLADSLKKLKPKKDDRGREYFEMNIADDEFIHFTRKDRVKQILDSGHLLMRPPHPKFGTDTVDAVSLVYGKFLPGVQTTHISKNPEKIAAIRFKTHVKPKYGYIEEVKWEGDVPLQDAKEVSYSGAVSLLSHTPDMLEDSDHEVKYI